MDDALRAKRWNEWAVPILQHIEKFERMHGKYVLTAA